MTTSSSFSPTRSRRIATVASVLTVIALTAAVLALAVGASLPESWWPRTGQAFAAESPSAHEDPCGLIVGPAKAYCERGANSTTSSAAETPQPGASAVWTLVPPAAGLAALVVWRRRDAARQGWS